MRARGLSFSLCALALALVALQAAETPLALYDDALWYRRSQVPVWRASDPIDYVFAVDIPGGCRLVYYAALHATGTADLPSFEPDYRLSPAANWRNCRFAPADAVMTMRGCNVIAYMVALACLYVVAFRALRRPLPALAAVSPLLISPLFPIHIVPRVGPDAFLTMGLCAFLLAWVWLRETGRDARFKWVIALGVCGGAVAFMKQNGALVLIAYAACLAFACRGWRRVAWPALALVAGSVVFYLLNPALFGRMPQEIITDILIRRAAAALRLERHFGPLSFLEVLQQSLPLWPFVPVALWACWRVRCEPWAAPVLWWGGALVLGTLFTINLPLERYLGPVELGLYFTSALAIMSRFSAPFPSAGTGAGS